MKKQPWWGRARSLPPFIKTAVSTLKFPCWAPCVPGGAVQISGALTLDGLHSNSSPICANYALWALPGLLGPRCSHLCRRVTRHPRQGSWALERGDVYVAADTWHISTSVHVLFPLQLGNECTKRWAGQGTGLQPVPACGLLVTGGHQGPPLGRPAEDRVSPASDPG